VRNTHEHFKTAHPETSSYGCDTFIHVRNIHVHIRMKDLSSISILGCAVGTAHSRLALGEKQGELVPFGSTIQAGLSKMSYLIQKGLSHHPNTVPPSCMSPHTWAGSSLYTLFTSATTSSAPTIQALLTLAHDYEHNCFTRTCHSSIKGCNSSCFLLGRRISCGSVLNPFTNSSEFSPPNII
jgi:hypothetical protein